MIIREMTDKDIFDVADLELQCFGKKDIENLEKCIKDPNYNYLVADNDGLVVGFLSYIDACDHAEVISIGVDKMYRNRGIGKELSSSMVSNLKKNKIPELFLEVRVDNIYAIKLYDKIGFEAISIRKKYYDGKVDAVIMKLVM